MMNNYPIIAIEGIDGAGKTTVARILADELGYLYLKTPDKPFVDIRSHFDHKSADPRSRLHFYIACLWDAYNKALRASNFSGVILDRYILSTYAYHKILCNGSCDVDGIISLSAPPPADLNIHIKISPATAAKRILDRSIEISGDHFERDFILQCKVNEIMEKRADVSVHNEKCNIDDTVESCRLLIASKSLQEVV